MEKYLGAKRLIGVLLSFILIFETFIPSIFAQEIAKLRDTVSQKDVSEIIREGFYTFRDTVDISEYGVSPWDLGAIFSHILKDDPYLFFVDRNLSYSFVTGGNVLCIKPRYYFSGVEAFHAWSICRDYVRDVARQAVEKESELERVLFVHNYICENFSYDESLLGDDLYKMITSGKGTCQGYTDLYSAILRECGIESHFVASDTVAHIWNYVKVDGEWYHSDVTWDDLEDGYRHRHFLLSDSVANERGHVDWYSVIYPMCDSNLYDGADIEEILHGEYSVGDIDHNGKFELMDVLLMRKRLEKNCDIKICEKCADITGNGEIDNADLDIIREKTVSTD